MRWYWPLPLKVDRRFVLLVPNLVFGECEVLYRPRRWFRSVRRTALACVRRNVVDCWFVCCIAVNCVSWLSAAVPGSNGGRVSPSDHDRSLPSQSFIKPVARPRPQQRRNRWHDPVACTADYKRDAPWVDASAAAAFCCGVVDSEFSCLCFMVLAVGWRRATSAVSNPRPHRRGVFVPADDDASGS